MRRWPLARLLAAAVAVPPVQPIRAQNRPAPADTIREKTDELPLKPARTVEFTTSEGTWISLDVSPDGRTIVFELLGDLYALPVAGGQAVRITSGPAFDSQPRYSPDGSKIVFLSDRSGSENIWICDADGAGPKALTKGDKNLYASPEWTPEGSYIVASKAGMGLGVYEIWLFHKDGGSGVSLTKDDKGPAPGPIGWGPQNNALGAAFGPDGRNLWYVRHRGGFGYNLQLPQWEIAIYDRQTGKVFSQTDVYGSAMRPVLSADGKWLAYGTRYDAETGLRLRNLATGDAQWLVYPVRRDDQESRFTRDLMPGSSFTPDSKALVVSYGGKIWRVEVPSGQATPIPFTAKVQQEIGPLVRFETRGRHGGRPGEADPRRDPLAGRQTARVQRARQAVRHGSSGRCAAAAHDRHRPRAGPWSEQGGYVQKLRADGKGKPQRLTPDPAFYDHPAWSPDGRRIVVIKGPRAPRITEHLGPGHEVAWLPAAGGATTRVSPISGDGRPHFSRDPIASMCTKGTKASCRCATTAPTGACTSRSRDSRAPSPTRSPSRRGKC